MAREIDTIKEPLAAVFTQQTNEKHEFSDQIRLLRLTIRRTPIPRTPIKSNLTRSPRNWRRLGRLMTAFHPLSGCGSQRGIQLRGSHLWGRCVRIRDSNTGNIR